MAMKKIERQAFTASQPYEVGDEVEAPVLYSIDQSESEEAFKTRLMVVCTEDVHTLIEKGRSYGDSWKRRGGVGAFMMLARKWDRLEQAMRVKGINYDIFKAILVDTRAEGVLDDIADLRRYLLLIEQHMCGAPDQPVTTATRAGKAGFRVIGSGSGASAQKRARRPRGNARKA